MAACDAYIMTHRYLRCQQNRQNGEELTFQEES